MSNELPPFAYEEPMHRHRTPEEALFHAGIRILQIVAVLAAAGVGVYIIAQHID